MLNKPRFGLNQRTKYGSKTITKIEEKEYLVEGYSKYCKCVSEVHPLLSSVSLENGPTLRVGDSFLGEGHIQSLQIIDSDNDHYFIIKVNLR